MCHFWLSENSNIWEIKKLKYFAKWDIFLIFWTPCQQCNAMTSWEPKMKKLLLNSTLTQFSFQSFTQVHLESNSSLEFYFCLRVMSAFAKLIHSLACPRGCSTAPAPLKEMCMHIKQRGRARTLFLMHCVSS